MSKFIEVLGSIFGTYNGREIAKIEKIVDQIEKLDDEMISLSDEELRNKTNEFKERLKNNETLDDILVETFAVVREAAFRTLGVHVVTVNDYLAQRDKAWMGKVYEFLGLTVGCIISGMENADRKKAYQCDITYGTNNEFGFDYIRDNMVVRKENKVQRGFNYAIIDEVDSTLIDEARTPLIISGAGTKSTGLYSKADNFIKTLINVTDC